MNLRRLMHPAAFVLSLLGLPGLLLADQPSSSRLELCGNRLGSVNIQLPDLKAISPDESGTAIRVDGVRRNRIRASNHRKV